MTDLDASIVSPVMEPVRRPVLSWLGKVFGDTFGVLGLAGKVLIQHWPVLLALALAGEIARARLVVWTAAVAFDHGEVALLVLAFAPLAVIVAMVLMLHRARRSLPALPGAKTERGGWLRNVGVFLIPFLVYYVSAGFLDDDFDEVVNYLQAMIFGSVLELDGYVGWHFTGLVVLALAAVIGGLRWLLRRWSFAQRHPIVALPATYLEALWLIGVAFWASGLISAALSWGQRRRVWVGATELLHGDFAAAGSLATSVRAASDFWLQTWSVVGTALVVPVTLLVAGSAVYGIRSHIENVPRPEPRHRAGGAFQAFSRSLVAIPRDAVWSRISPAVTGLRLLVRAGLVPMLVFCLAYVAVTRILASWLWVLERNIVGPQDFNKVWLPLNRILGVFNGAVVLTLIVCLAAGALGRVAATVGKAQGLADPQVNPFAGSSTGDKGSAGQEAHVSGQHGGGENANRDGLGIGRQQEVRGTAKG